MTTPKKIYTGNRQEFWIIFTKGNAWYTKLLKRGFGHMIVVTRDQYNWIILDPQHLMLKITIPAAPVDKDLPRAIAYEHDRIIKLSFCNRATHPSFGMFGLRTCVTMVKYMLGLRVWALTPYALFRKLLRFNQRAMDSHGLTSITRIQ